MERLPKGRLLEIGRNIDKLQAQGYKYMALSNYVYVLDLAHAHDLAASEGIHPFIAYFEALQARENKSRVVSSILADARVQQAIAIAKEADALGIEHPKMFTVIDYIKNKFHGKNVIVFAQYRSTTRKLAALLNEHGISAKMFVGKKEGVTRQHQSKIIEEFREGQFKVLCATSIAEEGLDIPSVDLVVFYEPVPSEIRDIQRRGRAGRMDFGEVVILVARGTRDESYLMASRAKERRMRVIISKIQTMLAQGVYAPGAGKGAGQKEL
jgi:Fanconi anemia group M protein